MVFEEDTICIALLADSKADYAIMYIWLDSRSTHDRFDCRTLTMLISRRMLLVDKYFHCGRSPAMGRVDVSFHMASRDLPYSP